MYIYCDESGSFVTAAKPESWCVIACYVLAESQRSAAREVLRRHKLRAGASHDDEVKRKATSEGRYFQFLEELAHVGGFAAAIATDCGANGGALKNQTAQVDKLIDALGEAEEGLRSEIECLIRDTSALSPQLYVEYGCRLHLAWRTIRLAALFFAERHPATLSRFRWKMDDKPPNLKNLYQSSIPGFIQELAKEQPLEVLAKADYRHLARFLIPDNVLRGMAEIDIPPAHLRIYNAACMMTEDVLFVDSKTCFGVQISDLIANGLRGCLRGDFKDNQKAARLLGRLLFDKDTERQVLPLLCFTEDPRESIHTHARAAVEEMGMQTRRLVSLQ